MDEDLPLQFVYLIEKAPWKKKDKKGYAKFEDGKWKYMSYHDTLK